jgi:erythromycin esterase-like protein
MAKKPDDRFSLTKHAAQRLFPRFSAMSDTAHDIPALIRAAAEPLPDLDSPTFGRLFDRFAKARVVLLGECSHGTSEFYRARAAITRRLIEEHGFTILAVEADWPDAAVIDRQVRGRPPIPDAEAPFQRFPTWMWRNRDVAAFLSWLQEWNAGRQADAQAGFYGLDLYNLAGSIEAVLRYLDHVDPEAASVARERYGCLMPWMEEPERYGRMALSRGYAPCEEGAVKTLRDLLEKQRHYSGGDGESFLDAAASARLVKNAEEYYRIMYYGGARSWNLRDTHMFETLCALLVAKGENSKAVVWAHNSHIGDASHTEMGMDRGELNIGQLCRERFGTEAALIGFGTHTGTVACATDWDEPMQVKHVNTSRPDSYERLAHDSGVDRFLLDLREGVHDPLREQLMKERLERFIGVIYRPETERWSHYSRCILPKQLDAYVWFDETSAVTPLPMPEKEGAEETYPFGL